MAPPAIPACPPDIRIVPPIERGEDSAASPWPCRVLVIGRDVITDQRLRQAA